MARTPKMPKAFVVPYSSIVGSSITLHGETGATICVLGLMNVGGDTPADHKSRSIAIADDVATRINSHDDLVNALEVLRDGNSDRRLDGLSPLFPDNIERLVKAVLAKARGEVL